ncbi:hypothetical protein PHYPSEUDO_013494 [Phytophthora pseudosyringae]|uniref:Uncharacterized protein n=1 Tax=Phytophthora pseudosyringae TaxID=221518 RepID=A0A8T1WHX6_9STRA|nr:hypothetical protein PHYPSEUDO_013494 [Phytophthora pseudosyringae]
MPSPGCDTLARGHAGPSRIRLPSSPASSLGCAEVLSGSLPLSRPCLIFMPSGTRYRLAAGPCRSRPAVLALARRVDCAAQSGRTSGHCCPRGLALLAWSFPPRRSDELPWRPSSPIDQSARHRNILLLFTAHGTAMITAALVERV